MIFEEPTFCARRRAALPHRETRSFRNPRRRAQTERIINTVMAIAAVAQATFVIVCFVVANMKRKNMPLPITSTGLG